MPPMPDPASDETVAQTVALPATRPPSLSRQTHASIAEEGRFVPGTLLGGRYRIIGLLGRGGMGEVYRATDLMLGQSVALKFLPEAASDNAFLLERFHSEVRVARQVSHPNVCRVYDIGEAEGVPFISMEYVDGEDLASLLQRIGRLPSDKALQAARQICAGLAAAHSKGVIHRDLKPQNVMMNKRGESVIMDFGLAAIADQLTGAEAQHGTPAYMSPEQLKGAEVTARSDIYALGLVLYELFTGKRAFDAKSIAELVNQQESGQLTSMTSIAAEIDPTVEKVIRRCLESDPARRPSTPLAVSAALPGGDPLAAALAAGETPSPDMVAAAGATAGLARKYSIPCLVLVLLAVFVIPLIKERSEAFFNASLDDPPAVLQHKARQIAVALGYAQKPADTSLALDQRRGLLTYLAKLPAPKKWTEWLAGEAPVSALYRESPEPLRADPMGFVDSTNPPPFTPGMAEVEVEGHGWLRGFSAVPYLPGHEVASPIPVDEVFRAAGLDRSRFAEVAPRTVPRGASDEFHAWKGPHPVLPATELSVEIASWKGRFTYVKFLWPWTPAPDVAPPAQSLLAGIRSVLLLVGVFAAVFFATLLARRNWKLGRGDRRGALRIGAAQFLIGMLIWVCRVHAIPNNGMVALFFNAVSDALLPTAALWLLYMAVEPELRARWPHTIVTWNRLLAGRWLDPQVASHVLIGAAVGAGLYLAASLPQLIQSAGPVDSMGGLFLLHGTRAWVAGMLSRADEALRVGLLVFFTICGLRAIFRKDWIAAIVGAAFFALMEGDVVNAANPAFTLAVFVVLYGGLIFFLLRLGLVVTAAAVFFINSLNGVTLGTDWTTWWTPAGLASMTLILAIALLAFRQSLASQDQAPG